MISDALRSPLGAVHRYSNTMAVKTDRVEGVVDDPFNEQLQPSGIV